MRLCCRCNESIIQSILTSISVELHMLPSLTQVTCHISIQIKANSPK